jgi:hypothetical protein
MAFSLFDIKAIRPYIDGEDDAYTPDSAITLTQMPGRLGALVGMAVSNSGTTPCTCSLYAVSASGSNRVLIAAKTVPAAGIDGTVAAVDMLASLPLSPINLLLLEGDYVWVVTFSAAPSAGKMLSTYALMAAF